MTRQRFLTVTSLAAVVVAGCHNGRRGHKWPPRPHELGPLHAQVTGTLLPCSKGGYVFSDFGRTEIDNRPLHYRLDPYRRVKTKDVVKVEVSQLGRGRDFDYKVLMSPPWRSGRTVEGWLESSDQTDPQSFSLGKDDPEPELCGPFVRLVKPGWLFACGNLPYIATEWVSAIAEGSMIAIQIVSPDEQRVYLIEGSGIKVTCLLGSNTAPFKWNTVKTYITVTRTGVFDSTCQFTEPQDIKAADWEVINDLKSAAACTD